MGLDTIELVMDVEDSFGIEIPDSVAQNILTVGDLYKFVVSKTELASNNTCLSASTFYDIKRALRSNGINERFGPSTKLSDVLPHANRRLFWSELAATLQLRLPELVRSQTVFTVNSLLTLGTSLIVAGLTYNATGSIKTSVIAALVSAVVIAVLTCVATIPMATQFGDNIETFRDFSQRVLSMNGSQQRSAYGPKGPNDVWATLCDIIAEQLAADRDKILPTSRFVEDLGVE